MASETQFSSPEDGTDRILRVGIIGCGEISQVAHIPNINFLAHRFRTTYLCDISDKSLRHCAQKVLGGTPKTTSSAEELCSSPNVDVVIIANADAYHVEHGLLALKNDKYCLIEKPASICFRDIDTLIEAEKTSRGKVFVGTMRRYATAFLDAVQEVGGMEKNTLGTHDLSAMREIIGMPQAVVGAILKLPGIFSVLFQYAGFPVTYESGLSGVPEFDAHIEVYSSEKIVKVEFDTPYIKGLPAIVTIREKVGNGYQERKIRKTYQDAYTLEMLEFYDCAVNGKTPKSSAEDARKDIELFEMIMKAGFKAT
ncbi:hypothetical protein G7Z17_g1969 [Cylindrodendrum hubeiense]|uniref:Gfo/Idh/MocA-like oxidoreductase N-terminal domain-containing protein n=1 Tax=Cylindrodendrum hubeiense TaxID=595255 RepID=A0A9P5HDP6_9HYPO|nr:hypothetical protein G7Z17_g1969 [Cylindrodendrum hubeiense]